MNMEFANFIDNLLDTYQIYFNSEVYTFSENGIRLFLGSFWTSV